jgi:hypothetical protein
MGSKVPFWQGELIISEVDLNQSFSGDGEPFVGRQVCELSEDVEREYFFGRTKMRRGSTFCDWCIFLGFSLFSE